MTRAPLNLFRTLLAVGLGVGLTGTLLSHPTTMYGGILATIATATGLVCATLHHTRRLTATDRAQEFEAGYHTALHHVALGLLDGHPVGGNVVPIPRPHDRQAE